jgi:uncharacterized protein
MILKSSLWIFPALHRALSNLSAILDKSAAHAAQNKIEPSVLLNSRLFPDMYPLVQQVQIASDVAKAAGARLAGVEPPKFPDTETSFDELKARIAKTVDFLKTLKPAQIDGSEDRDISILIRGETHTFKGRPICSTSYCRISISTSRGPTASFGTVALRSASVIF